MADVFVIQNQDALFLSKQGDWVGVKEASSIFRTTHKDEAINIKVEHSVRDPHLRLQILTCSIDERGQLQLPRPGHQPGEKVDLTPAASFSASSDRAGSAAEVETTFACSRFETDPKIP